jgi:type VI secretion system secreted protein VgrG
MLISQQNREVNIQTPLGEDVLVLSNMSMTEELGRLFSIDVELLSAEENINFDDLLGQNVTITLDLIDDNVRYFNGYISHFAQTANRGAYAVYQATIRPWLWFLTRTSDCRIFQEQTVPEIINAVFSDLGYTDIEEKLSNTYPTWTYCVQYRESDFNFVSRLMEQEGIYYYFKHFENKHILVISDSYASHEPLIYGDQITFYPEDGSAVREEEHCSSWHIGKQIQSGKYVLNDFDFKRPKANLEVNAAISRQHSVSDYEIYDYPGEYIKTDEGDNYVQSRIEELHTQFAQAQGQGSVRRFKTGDLFSLNEYSRDDQNREYLIVSVTHNIQSDAFESTDSRNNGMLYSNHFSCIDSQTPFRPARLTPKPIVQGTQTAIVVGPSGEEIYTDEHAQVKVQFHWDRYGKFDENSSCWIRVSQLWAGKNWGGIHIPRIGQEVIVDFLEGDPDRPIIVGRVYNGEQVPPYGLPANKTQSGIKSRSSKGGSGANFNEIRMEDKKGKEQVYIHAEKNQDNIVENDETTFVGHDRTEKVGNDETISIGHDRTEDVGNHETIKIGVNRTESVGKNEKITIGNNRSELVVKNETIKIGVNRTESVGNNEKISIGINRSESVGKDEKISIGNNRTESVAKDEKISIGKNRTESVGENETIKIGKNKKLNIADNCTESIGKDQSITIGKKLTIDVGDQITIKTRKASNTLKKDGTIQISGKDITVNGSGKINVKASNNITMKGKKILQN